VAVKTPTTGEVPRLLARALRMADGGPQPFYRAALASLAVTSLGIMAIASVRFGVVPGGRPAYPGSRR
jgi:hypothetical protein